MRRYSSLTPVERRRLARRLRLEWASGGDLSHANGVGQMVAEAERIDARHGRPTIDERERERELEAAYDFWNEAA